MEVIHDFLRQWWPDESGGVKKKAAARALAAADPNSRNPERWRTRVRRIVERRETSEGESLFAPKVLEEIVDAMRGIGPDAEAWIDEHLKTSLGIEQQEFGDERGFINEELWKLRYRRLPELDVNEKAFEVVRGWLKETVKKYGPEATRRELGIAVGRVRPLLAFPSDREQCERLAKALKEASDWLSSDAEVVGRKWIVARRRHGEPTRAQLAILQEEERQNRIAMAGGSELPDQPEPPRRAGKALAFLEQHGPGPVPIVPARPPTP